MTETGTILEYIIENIEVKTTSSDNRQHYISSINQLEPSLDCKLALVSIQLAPTKSTKNSISVTKLIKQIEQNIPEIYSSMLIEKLWSM